LTSKCTAIDSRMYDIFNGDELRFWDNLEIEAEKVVKALEECDMETLKCYAPWFDWLAHTTTFNAYVYSKIESEYVDRITKRLCKEIYSGINSVDYNIILEDKIFNIICDSEEDVMNWALSEHLLEENEWLKEGSDAARRIVGCLREAGVDDDKIPDWILELAAGKRADRAAKSIA